MKFYGESMVAQRLRKLKHQANLASITIMSPRSIKSFTVETMIRVGRRAANSLGTGPAHAQSIASVLALRLAEGCFVRAAISSRFGESPNSSSSRLPMLWPMLKFRNWWTDWSAKDQYVAE
jgi:hypothetical protein